MAPQVDLIIKFGCSSPQVSSPARASDPCMPCTPSSAYALTRPVRSCSWQASGKRTSGRCRRSSWTTSSRARRRPPSLTRRQPASRAAPLGAPGRRPPPRPAPGAGWGGYRSLTFDSHRFLVGASGHGSAEPSSSAAAAAAAAAVGPLAAARATRRRRRVAARRGATQPSSGLQVSTRWLGRRQRSPAYVRWPCTCSALVCARICSCSRRADGRCCECTLDAACRRLGGRRMDAGAASCGRAGC